jgi:hypothetical protein
MALLDKLNTQGSTLKKTSTAYAQQTKLVGLLPKSLLDLDGKTPKDTYKNTAPEKQGGRI